MKCAGHDRESL